MCTLSAAWWTVRTGTPIRDAAVFACVLLFFSNAFNLLDNADGHCASIGIAVLVGVSVATGNPVAFMVACGTAGFIVWNWPPPRIFLGDAGSLLIGVWCVMIALMWHGWHYSSAARLLPIFWVPLYDTMSVIVVRIRQGRHIYVGGQDHLSHRMMQRGMRIETINLLLAVGTLAIGIACAFAKFPIAALIAVCAMVALAVWELAARPRAY
jgi:UDP-GlcNAc:undecaprenyl-phosphate GlcNAc-1-phosphate transferase